MANAASPWVLELRRPPAPRARFYGFAHAGGKASTYQRWCDHLPPDVGVHAVELPGRGRRSAEPLAVDFSRVVDAIAAAIEPDVGVPFALFGHCLGAAVAFECAHALRARTGLEPAHLFVAGLAAPQLPRRGAGLHALGEDALIERLIAFGGLAPALVAAPELLRRLLPRVRADFALYANYHYAEAPRLRCPVTALGGADDPVTDARSLDAWGELGGATFERSILPGNHFFVEAHLPDVAARVTAALSEVSPR